MNIRGLRAGLAVLFLAAASAAASDVRAEVAIRDSLSRVHPRMRARWLKERGLDDSYYTTFRKPDSQGLHEVGRWSHGPSYDVDGRATPSETLVALARGSGVSLLRFSRQDSLSIELLSDINAEGLMTRVKIADTLLYVGSAAGLEIWNIADERNPARLSRIQTALNDFDVEDSLAYVIGADDSFKVYNVSDPANPIFKGACRDSGYCLSVTDSLALVADRWGLHVIGVGNPASPHRLNSWGSAIDAVTGRGNLAYVTTFNPNQPGEIALTILDVSAPQNIVQLGHLNGPGGPEVYLIDTLAFCSGDAVSDTMKIVSVANSAQPRLIGTGRTRGWDEGIWASGLNKAAFVADNYEGLWVFDIASTANPVLDTVLSGVDLSFDVYIDNGRAYVANARAGMKILDVSDPTKPFTLGSYDTAGQAPDMRSAAAKDSFAFAGWGRPALLTLSVSDPSHPVAAGGCDSVINPPEDIVIRDTYAYIAEATVFQVVNVARPREPVLVGSCVLPSDVMDLDLEDSLAFVTTLPFSIVNVARPTSPVLVGSSNVDASGVDAVDTIAYITAPYTGLVALNVARPAQPMTIDSLYLPNWWNDVVVVGTRSYVGGTYIKVVDISDPTHLRVIGSWTPPYLVRRLCYSAPYLYAACYEAGVCVLESTGVGVSETPGRDLISRVAMLAPNPTSGRLEVSLGGRVTTGGAWTVRDVAGRLIRSGRVAAGQSRFTVDLTSEPSGVYMVELEVTRHGQLGQAVKL
jgi:hypothetical protein